MTSTDSGSHRRDGARYKLTKAEVEQYAELGYVVLKDVISEAEMKEELDPWFEHFISGKEMHRMGRDFCDMSQPYGTPFDQFQLVNAMLPSSYRTELAGSIYHRVAQDIASQLYVGGQAGMDYEQFLAKRPNKDGAEFVMHQDIGYWPKTENTWTATVSLALSDSNLANGCLQVIPGSNNEPQLRKHTPAGDSREDSHTLVIEALPGERPTYLPVTRGSVTVHDERIVHGSGGNSSDGWRKTYVMAFRDAETIKAERAIGFTHSHNDNVNWDEVVF
ncbi:MAG: hypothetical protein ACI80V_002039 [Rhodothermales bacterium]|jgi:hypothetical protein